MKVDLRMPNINGNDREQLQQIRSYLYQFIPQLQWALDSIDTVSASGNTTPAQTGAVQPTTSTNNSFDAGVAFGALKPLIIKSAEIVNAYYEEINKRLEGLYVAESDFGVYAEQTSLAIEANSKAITQYFEDTQVIIQNRAEELNTELKDYTDSQVNDIKGALDETSSRLADTEGMLETTRTEMNTAINEANNNSTSYTDKLIESTKAELKGSIDDLEFLMSELQDLVLGVKGYIRSGIMHYTNNEVPVYGIEIGQEVEVNGEIVFKKFTRLSSEKLSFYDANTGIEVAYISDKKLYIGQAEITISLQIGGFIKLVLPNKDVVEKWIGG